jgi:hypothetical protein
MLMSSPAIPKYLYFRSDGYFFQIMTTFFSSVVGLRGLVDASNPLGIKKNERLPIQGLIHSQFSISSFELFEYYRGNVVDTSVLTATLCGMLANTGYESVKSLNNKSPAFEFFRHIRNSASHGNVFTFLNGEPRRPAEWRGKTISSMLAGTRCFFDFIGPADIVLLMWDIEQNLSTTTPNDV